MRHTVPLCSTVVIVECITTSRYHHISCAWFAMQVPGNLYQQLPAAVTAGLVTQAQVDDAVRRVLNHKFCE